PLVCPVRYRIDLVAVIRRDHRISWPESALRGTSLRTARSRQPAPGPTTRSSEISRLKGALSAQVSSRPADANRPLDSGVHHGRSEITLLHTDSRRLDPGIRGTSICDGAPRARRLPNDSTGDKRVDVGRRDSRRPRYVRGEHPTAGPCGRWDTPREHRGSGRHDHQLPHPGTAGLRWNYGGVPERG